MRISKIAGAALFLSALAVTGCKKEVNIEQHTGEIDEHGIFYDARRDGFTLSRGRRYETPQSEHHLHFEYGHLEDSCVYKSKGLFSSTARQVLTDYGCDWRIEDILLQDCGNPDRCRNLEPDYEEGQRHMNRLRRKLHVDEYLTRWRRENRLPVRAR